LRHPPVMAANHPLTSLKLKQVKLTHGFLADKKCNALVVTEFGSGLSKRMPALKTGGLYKTYYRLGTTVL
jgi:hypothetical protein